jgi:hypothetical protein
MPLNNFQEHTANIKLVQIVQIVLIRDKLYLDCSTPFL